MVAVLGNHDHWTDPELVRQTLRDGGVTELANEVMTLRRGDASLHVAGLDDVWEEQQRLERVLDRLPGAVGAASASDAASSSG